MPARTSRTADKASVIAQLQPLLQPRLDQDGISWDEASPLLGQMPLDALQRALATTNVQPVWAKLRAAAYKRPALRKLGSSENLLQQKLIAQLQPALLPHLQEMGLSWDDALPEVKQMMVEDLDGSLDFGCVSPIVERLARSRSVASTPAASVASVASFATTDQAAEEEQDLEKATVIAHLKPLLQAPVLKSPHSLP